MNRTQELEKYYFENFRQVYKLPKGLINYADKPDIIIKSSQTLGIEITNFYLNDGKTLESEQRQNPIRQKIIIDAHNIYQENGGRNIEVSLGFNFIKSENGLAKKIAEFISQLKNQKSGSVSPHLFNDIPELSFVYYNTQEYQDPQWRLIQSYSTPIMDVSRLLEIIHEKEERAKNYQQCDAYWLLIVIDFINRAQDQEISNVVLPKIQSHVFEKILVYKTAYNDVFEVTSN